MTVAVYPIMMRLDGGKCLVVGGGRIALRKVIGLLRAGAAVTVVAPEFHAHFRRLTPVVNLLQRPYSASDITGGYAVIIGATDSPGVNEQVSRDARALNIPCNIVDRPELCSFFVPAVVRRGDAVIAVSTGGTSPRFSRYMKSRIAGIIGSEYADLSAYMAGIRLRINTEIPLQQKRFLFWEALFETDPLDYIHRYGWPEFRKRTELLIGSFSEKGHHL